MKERITKEYVRAPDYIMTDQQVTVLRWSVEQQRHTFVLE